MFPSPRESLVMVRQRKLLLVWAAWGTASCSYVTVPLTLGSRLGLQALVGSCPSSSLAGKERVPASQ